MGTYFVLFGHKGVDLFVSPVEIYSLRTLLRDITHVSSRHGISNGRYCKRDSPVHACAQLTDSIGIPFRANKGTIINFYLINSKIMFFIVKTKPFRCIYVHSIEKVAFSRPLQKLLLLLTLVMLDPHMGEPVPWDQGYCGFTHQIRRISKISITVSIKCFTN